jgi:DNA-directed RNA polymerase specialized sigma24 family protein
LSFGGRRRGSGTDDGRSVSGVFEPRLGTRRLAIAGTSSHLRPGFGKTKCAADATRSKGNTQAAEAVAFLPWKERAVFALRSMLGFDDMTTSEVVEIPIQEVRSTWMKALFRLRELLPKEFFKGRKT